MRRLVCRDAVIGGLVLALALAWRGYCTCVFLVAVDSEAMVMTAEQQDPVVAGHAFLSYVREDAAQVERLQQALLEAGIPVWRDKTDLWPGEDWQAKIRAAITEFFTRNFHEPVALLLRSCLRLVSEFCQSRGSLYRSD